MASFDLKSLITSTQAIPAAALSGTSETYPILDTAGGESVTFIISSSGLSSAGDRNILIEQSDDSDFGVYEEVPLDRVIPTGSVFALSSTDPEIVSFGVVNTKRYLRLSIDAGNTVDFISGVMIKSTLLHNPE